MHPRGHSKKHWHRHLTSAQVCAGFGPMLSCSQDVFLQTLRHTIFVHRSYARVWSMKLLLLEASASVQPPKFIMVILRGCSMQCHNGCPTHRLLEGSMLKTLARSPIQDFCHRVKIKSCAAFGAVWSLHVRFTISRCQGIHVS